MRGKKPAGFFEKMIGAPSRWVGDPIRVHLNLLLNTRAGSVPHLPDYGVPDMSTFYSDYPASRVKLAAVIEDLIRKYEPRLHNPFVKPIEFGKNDFRLSFLITGEIDEYGEVAVVKYRTTISSNGQTAFSDED